MIISTQSKIRTIKSDDPKFKLTDGVIAGQRAGFEIKQETPAEYKTILFECLRLGYIKPVAFVHERELLFMGLS